MNMNQQHIQHLKQLQELKHENEQLKIELEFMKQIFNHGEAMVFQMKRFTKKDNLSGLIHKKRLLRNYLN